MNAMHPRVYCSLCAIETEHHPYLENGHDWEYGVAGVFTQGKCIECGLVTMIPMPALAEIMAFYPDTYHGYQEGGATNPLTRWLIRRNLKQREKFYASLIGNSGSILDVGSGEGTHFDVWTEEKAWDIRGFEFNEAAATLGRARGRDIETATLETYDTKGKKFDLIIVNHLLEHVVDPYDTVVRAYALLAPGGYLVGETPNIASLDFALFKTYWGGCHWPRHLHQFSRETLGAMFHRAGFKDVRFNYPLHTSHWALSIQNLLQSSRFTHVSLKNGRAWYYPFLLLACIPINLVQKMTGHTGIIGFVMQKPKDTTFHAGTR